MNTQPAPLPQPSTNMWGKQTRMSSLDMANRQFSNTPEDKFQDQLTLLHIMQTNRSTINNENIKTKTPNNNTPQWNLFRKLTLENNH